MFEDLIYAIYEATWWQLILVVLFIVGSVQLVINVALHILADIPGYIRFLINSPVIAIINIVHTILGIAFCAIGNGYNMIAEQISDSFEIKK